MVDGNKLNSEVLYQMMDALMLKYRGGWPRLAHLSADYPRESGTITVYPRESKARPTIRSRALDSAHMTGERKSCMPSGCDIWVRS